MSILNSVQNSWKKHMLATYWRLKETLVLKRDRYPPSRWPPSQNKQQKNKKTLKITGHNILKPLHWKSQCSSSQRNQEITDFKRENTNAMTLELVTISKPKQENPKNHRSQISWNPKVEITHSVNHHRETKGYADFQQDPWSKHYERSTQRYGWQHTA